MQAVLLPAAEAPLEQVLVRPLARERCRIEEAHPTGQHLFEDSSTDPVAWLYAVPLVGMVSLRICGAASGLERRRVLAAVDVPRHTRSPDQLVILGAQPAGELACSVDDGLGHPGFWHVRARVEHECVVVSEQLAADLRAVVAVLDNIIANNLNIVIAGGMLTFKVDGLI